LLGLFFVDGGLDDLYLLDKLGLLEVDILLMWYLMSFILGLLRCSLYVRWYLLLLLLLLLF